MRNLPEQSATSSSAMPKIVKGQLWQVGTRLIKIGHVGRVLVHHRTVVPSLKRPLSPESFSLLKEFQQLLNEQEAVLVQN
jgi:hypothetical protein